MSYQTRRTNLQIKVSLLQATINPMIQTRIQYKTGLNRDKLMMMLDEAIELGLIEKQVTKRRTYYEITPKGMEILQQGKRIHKYLQSVRAA